MTNAPMTNAGMRCGRTLFYFLVLLFTLLASSASAYLNEVGISAVSFGVGARPQAIGAFVAQADDVTAAMYNPAGLAFTKGISLNSAPDNISAFQVYPSPAGYAVGFGLVFRNLSGYNENLLVGSAAWKLSYLPMLPQNNFTDNLSVGANLKAVLSQSYRQAGITDQYSSGWDMDLGVLWKTRSWLSFGGNLQNFLGNGTLGAGRFVWTSGTVEAIPEKLILGTSVKLIGDADALYYLLGNELFVNLDYNTALSGGESSQLTVGAEWAYWNTYFARAGLGSTGGLPGSGGFSCGAGVRKEGWGVDLAATNLTDSRYSKVLLSFLYFPKDWTFVERQPITDSIKVWVGEEEDVYYEDSMTISGEVASGGHVYINGADAYLSDGETFSVVVPLNLGKNLIDIKGEYRGKTVLHFEKKVLRKAKVVIAEEKAVEQKIDKLIKTEERKITEQQQQVEAKLKSSKTTQGQKTELLKTKKKLAAQEKKVTQKKTALVKEKQKIAERKEKVEVLVTMGVVEVAPNKEFEMEAAVSRGELASWLVKAAGIPLEQVTSPVFKDVPPDHPLAPYIKAVSDLEVMQGFPDGTFRPDAPVTESEGKAIFKKFGIIQ
ncbi:MAG: S-layer homology domain-containing protein [Candidatus Margulisiibacteriota bacterium]